MRTTRTCRSSRLISWLLLFSLMLGLFPALQPAASAASWADEYLNKLVSWGVMRGDQAGNLDPDRDITRAEFLSMINRAYGYTEPARTPFTDVSPAAWYADDIGIAYKAGYFTGTSANTAAPDDTLTREQATVILGRNLMLQEGAGESLDFTDSRELSNWSRGLVKTAAEYGVVKGLPDGTFQPQRNITRGEVASLLVNAIGTPVNASGEYSLGSIYGNVTISASGVTLRNTVIAGDLYLTGGVGLGYVTLENVTVLGKIIASGAGEANKGDSSIILRNVTSQEMVVDSPANQYVTIRSEGDTLIEKTSVRTPSYLEDVTGTGMGLKYIELNGESGTTLELSGNIKEVVNLTPGSTVNLALGSAQTLTVDEAASGSKLNIAGGAEIKTLNLDTGASVTGDGDVETLNVNSNGSTVSMLPDNIVIRPGVNANVNGTVMDSATGAESSQEPKLLSGYPRAADVAPTSANALFSTNKSGTIYWAVSSITDGSVSESDLIAPPSYGSKILKSGSVNATSASSELTAKITGLTSDGSYYLSAVLVDSRDQRSPVKVVAFTTPDDSVPNFAAGYPVMTKVEDTSAQVTAMTTKSCKLYYAVMPKGSTAPTPADFKANSLTGNLGNGILDATKNTTLTFTVSTKLFELETYDLYLWLNDADGAKSSAVKKITFTTVDRTPPTFMTPPTVNSVKATSIGAYAVLDEPGTIYWVVVPRDTRYPIPLAGQGEIKYTDPAAKLQVEAGMNALKSGNVAVSAANKDVTLNITGLTEETAYDLYYVAKDKAGNYSASIDKIQINTLDVNGPTATIEFTRFNGTEKTRPLADTDIRIIFNEGVQAQDGDKMSTLVSLYEAIGKAAQNEKEAARNKLAEILERSFELYDITAGSALDPVPVRTAANANNPNLEWVIDFRYATVVSEDGKTVVTFPTNNENPAQSALNLKSGSTYYFKVDRLFDTSTAANPMGTAYLPDRDKGFTTVFAQLNIDAANVWNINEGSINEIIDMSFRLTPVSTDKADDSILYDLILWSDSNLEFDLYSRQRSAAGQEFGAWGYVTSSSYTLREDGSFVYRSLADCKKNGTTITFPQLNELKDGMITEYAIQVTKLNGNANRETWNKIVNMQVTVAAGNQSALQLVTNGSTEERWNLALNEGVVSIGLPDPFAQKMPFSDSKPPELVAPYPQFTPSDTMADMTFLLDREGTIYYVVTPVTETKDDSGATIGITTPVPPTAFSDTIGKVLPELVPSGGDDTTVGSNPLELSLPTRETVVNGVFTDPTVRHGSIGNSSASTSTQRLTDLQPDTTYYVYLITQGTAQVLTPRVLCYKFKTEPIVRPVIELSINNPSVTIQSDRNAKVQGLLVTEDATYLNSTVLGRKMSTCLDSSLSDAMKAWFDTTGTYKDYTILQAMLQDMRENNRSIGSLFDLCADQGAKNDVANFIRTQSEDSTTNVALVYPETALAANGALTVDCASSISVGSRYVFLAVGKSDIGSGDAFRAARSVFKQDGEKPKVLSCNASGRFTSDGSRFIGSLTVTFTKPIYKNVEGSGSTLDDKIPVLVMTATETVTGAPANSYAKLGTLLTLPLTGVKLISQEGSYNQNNLPPMTTVQFELSGMMVNDSITFNSTELRDAAGNMQQMPLTLTLKKDENGAAIFTISPSAWDGTSQ